MEVLESDMIKGFGRNMKRPQLYVGAEDHGTEEKGPVETIYKDLGI